MKNSRHHHYANSLMLDTAIISASTIKVSFTRKPFNASLRFSRSKNCEKPPAFNDLENQCLAEKRERNKVYSGTKQVKENRKHIHNEETQV